MDPETHQESSELILNEVQLLLAEKRTSLSTLRTGIVIWTMLGIFVGVLLIVGISRLTKK